MTVMNAEMTDTAAAPPNTPVWDDGGWAGLPRLRGDVTADVCVVGLGGSGLSAIGELRRLGASVVGVDAGTVAAGAAGRNGGFLLAGSSKFYHDAVAAYGRERALGIYRLTMAELDRIAAETPRAVRRVGSLRIAADAGEVEDCRAQLAAMTADGLKAEWYEGPEGAGFLVPTDAAFNPLHRCRILAARHAEAGARLFEHSPAVHIAAEEVRTPEGRVRCGRVIVAVDGRLERLLPALEGRVRTARLQMVATAPLPDIRFPRPVYMRYGYEWWQQLADGRIALGGFRDRGGDPQWTHDAEPCDAVQGMIDGFLRGTLGIHAPITHRWAASVSFTDDGLPVLAEVEPGVWACGGYSGTGNVIGAICGRAAAQMAVTGRSELAGVFGG
ncbi:MAG TPA: FAD-binding oxidoreductase [Longimicrobium sp.]|nr:FAD-binding oxidoreductase [Longimicrobium sp.]